MDSEYRDMERQGLEKVCNICLLIKPVECFLKAKLGKFGRCAQCRDCRKVIDAKHRASPEGKVAIKLASAKCYRKKMEAKRAKEGWIPHELRTDRKCGACILIKGIAEFIKESKGIHGKGHICISCSRLKSKERYKNNKEKVTATNNRWKMKNREKLRLYVRASYRRYKYHPTKYLTRTMRTQLGRSIRSGSGKLRYLDYTVEQLKEHLEARFTDGMSWDNRGKWHIDHIMPLASFKFDSPQDQEFKEAWALSNLQPLWALDNIRKGAKVLHSA